MEQTYRERSQPSSINSRMNTLIATLEGVNIINFVNANGDELVQYKAKAAVDGDGSGSNPYRDPDFQPDTSLHIDGKALDADAVPFIVVPPQVCQKTVGTVLGSLCWVQHSKNFEWTYAVVGDIGPRDKVGEISSRCASLIGLNPSAVSGGTSEQIINYWILVGIPALIDGVQYKLQPYTVAE